MDKEEGEAKTVQLDLKETQDSQVPQAPLARMVSKARKVLVASLECQEI